MIFINIVHILEHISEQLHTIVRYFKNNKSDFLTICKRIDLIDNFDNDIALLSEISNTHLIPKIILYQNKTCYFIIQSNKDKFLVGPIFLEEVFIGHNLFRDELFVCSLETLLSFILLLHNTINKNILTKNEIINYNFQINDLHNNIQEKFVTSLLENIENNQKHNSHYKEIRELNSIKNGDIVSLMKSWEEDLVGVHGRLAKDKERQEKNLAITSLILASRAAIEGGLN